MDKLDYTTTMNFESNVRHYCQFMHGLDVDFYDLREWADDIEHIRQILKTIDIHTSHLICYWMWLAHSLDFCAGWLMLNDDEIIYIAKQILDKPEID